MKQRIHTVTCQIQWVFRGRVAPCHRVRTFHVRHCNTLQHAATHCNTLQHPALHCNSISTHSTHESGAVSVSWNIEHRISDTATPCNTLQHPALQHTSLSRHMYKHSWVGVLRGKKHGTFLIRHRNTLQHPATPCNTPQHPATPCNTHLIPDAHAYIRWSECSVEKEYGTFQN